MPHVITENCINCKSTHCVEVCPVDAFHEGPNSLVINPRVCTDCAFCKAACPMKAIYGDVAVPNDQQEFKQLNAELSAIWPGISKKIASPPDVEEWNGVPDKLKLLVK